MVISYGQQRRSSNNARDRNIGILANNGETEVEAEVLNSEIFQSATGRCEEVYVQPLR